MQSDALRRAAQRLAAIEPTGPQGLAARTAPEEGSQRAIAARVASFARMTLRALDEDDIDLAQNLMAQARAFERALLLSVARRGDLERITTPPKRGGRPSTKERNRKFAAAVDTIMAADPDIGLPSARIKASEKGTEFHLSLGSASLKTLARAYDAGKKSRT